MNNWNNSKPGARNPQWDQTFVPKARPILSSEDSKLPNKLEVTNKSFLNKHAMSATTKPYRPKRTKMLDVLGSPMEMKSPHAVGGSPASDTQSPLSTAMESTQPLHSSSEDQFGFGDLESSVLEQVMAAVEGDSKRTVTSDEELSTSSLSPKFPSAVEDSKNASFKKGRSAEGEHGATNPLSNPQLPGGNHP